MLLSSLLGLLLFTGLLLGFLLLVGFLLVGLPLAAIVAAFILVKVPYFSRVRPVVPWFLFPLLGLSAGGWCLVAFILMTRSEPAGVLALVLVPAGGFALGLLTAARRAKDFAPFRIQQ
jgi:hypothetical protein